VSLAFGVLFATVVTLLVVPSGYIILEDIRRFLSRGNREINDTVKDKSL